MPTSPPDLPPNQAQRTLQRSVDDLRDCMTDASRLINVLQQERRATPQLVHDLSQAIAEGLEMVTSIRAATKQPAGQTPDRLLSLETQANLQVHRIRDLVGDTAAPGKARGPL